MRLIVRLYRFLVISIVLLIFGVSYLGCKQKVPVNPDTTSQNRGNSIGNLLNGGFVAQDQDWIYYVSINPQGLYKVPINGKKKQKVCDDIASSINVLSDWIYYSNATDNSCIYKVKTDGSERQKLSDDKVLSLSLVGDWLYYCNTGDNFAVYKIKTDGSGRQLLSSDNPIFVLAEKDWLYYSLPKEESAVYRINSLDGSERNQCNNLFSVIFNIQDDWIYYLKYNQERYGNQLCKMKLDGSQDQLLHEDLVSAINVSGDWIYYINKSDQSKIYKMKTDGSERQKLYDEPFSSYPNIAGDWLYFMNENKFGMLFRIRTDGSGYEAVVEY